MWYRPDGFDIYRPGGCGIGQMDLVGQMPGVGSGVALLDLFLFMLLI